MSFYSLTSYSQLRINQGALDGGTPTPPPFVNSQSILLDGVDDYVDIGNLSAISNTSTFSVSTWFKTNNISSQTFLWSQGSGSSQLFAPSISTKDLIVFSGSSSIFVRRNNVFNSTDWFNLVVVYNGSLTNAERIKLYLNGSLLVTSVSGTIPTTTPTFTTNVKIGGITYLTNYTFNGNIDETSFFNNALSQTDVNTIYGSGVPSDVSTISGITNWYRCGDGDTAPTLTDNIGSNDGTMTNFSTFSTDVPTIPFSTRSIALDGVDDFVTFGNMSNFSGATQFTFSGWYKMNVKPATDGLFDVHIDNNNFFNILPFSNGVMYIQFKVGGTLSFAQVNYNSLITQGQYFHIAVAYDGSQSTNSTKLKVYIDNVNIAYGQSGTFPSSLAIGTNDVRIGSLQYTTALLDGNADECSVFNTQLSQSDVTAIYGGGSPSSLSSYSSLVSWWRCGDGDTAPILTDNKGSNDGTMTNFTTFSTDVPT